MSIAINNNNGIIDIIQNLSVPRSYFKCGGSGKAIGNDYVQIKIDKDTYDVLWTDLDIDGNIPESQYAALYMLAQVFAGVPVNPPAPSPTTLKVNPPLSTTFNIPEYVGYSDADFTIEWLQYMHTDANFPRIYSIGQYPAQNAISIEGNTLYLWLNGGIQGSYSLSGYLNTWVHVVVTRFKSDIHVWVNGYEIITITYPNAIPTNGHDFYIGSENASDTYYNGLISNFRFIIGNAIYGDASPTYPTAPLGIEFGTILLIGQGTDLSSQLIDQTATNTITNTNVVYNSDSGILGDSNGSLQFGII